MQFLCCKVHFLMIYAPMWPTFGELAGFNIDVNIEIFGALRFFQTPLAYLFTSSTFFDFEIFR